MPVPGINTVAILGIGQMGAAAAVAYKRAGYRVLLWARNPEKLHATSSTLDRLNTWMDEQIGRSTRSPGTIDLVTDLDAVDGSADLVLDCIAEDMDQK